MKPTGPYRVGQILLDWTDTSRPEPGTPEIADNRQIPAQIWYPAADDSGSEQAPYRPRVEAFRGLWADESVDLLHSVQTAWLQQPTVHSEGPFPVLLFSHGWSARSSSHGTFLGNLASHGYVVVGINHPFLGKVVLANGRLTEPDDNQFADQAEANGFYAEDVRFVLNQMVRMNRDHHLLRDAIDLTRVAASGHSSGFPAVSGAAVVDDRIRALISFDAGVPQIVRRQGLDVPILLVRAESNSYTDLFFRGQNVHPKGTIYDVDFFRVHRGDFFDLVIEGTTHNSIYDEYLFAETPEERSLSLRNHELMAAFTTVFLEQVWMGTSPSSLISEAERSSHCSVRVIPAMR
jgi:hypothetical protein